ncbi:MAG: glycosyltransferase 61 family protein [Prochlorococcus sp.]|nr:glycosyltransferase 61 family protein [Prochlorococcaceae cyanobacterium Fu_MAG_50]
MSFDIHEFRHIPVLPFTRWFNPHQGGPLWPNWDHALEQRHCRDGKPNDIPPEVPSDEDLFATGNSGFWCGPIHYHFGHQILEFSTRIPVYVNHLQENQKLIFGTHKNQSEFLVDQPIFFRQILEWYEIPERSVVISATPTIFKTLSCAKQQEQWLDVPGNENYIELLSKHAAKRLNHPRSKGLKAYVSRTCLQDKTMAGEGYLEEFLAANGFTIIHPEKISLIEQLSTYNDADLLLFSEGSAVHCLQLLGKIKARIAILSRRKNRPIAEKILSTRSQHVEHFDNIKGILDTVWADNKIAHWKALTLLRQKGLKRTLRSLGVEMTHWSNDDFQNAVENDIRSWISTQLQRPNFEENNGIKVLKRSLNALNMRSSSYLNGMSK